METQNNLKYLYTLQKTHFYIHSKYSNNLNAIDFVTPKTVVNGGTANYNYEVVNATNNSFRAKAIAVTNFDDGIFNVWEINQDQNLKEIVKD